MKTIPEEIGELRALDVAGLTVRYEALFGRPPRVKHREYLWKRCAWKLQEARLGGLSAVAQRRLEELIAEIDLPIGERARTVTGKLAAMRSPAGPVAGTTLVRDWRGQRVEVRVLDAGFEWNGVSYRSLSAVAQAVTGTHWNGRLFFGLRARKGA